MDGMYPSHTMITRRWKIQLAMIVACLSIGFGAPAMATGAKSILFIGNSFTAGMHSAVWRYRAFSVHDLNHDGVGGVPALFKLLTKEAGLNYKVSVETVPGKGLKYHFNHERSVLDHSWDDVVMQEYSTLDPHDPGNPMLFRKYAHRLASMFAKKNRNVNVWLLATWSRPDLTYKESSPWHGKSIYAMGKYIQKIYIQVADSSPYIKGVIPVGSAFNLAVKRNMADPDPYSGIAYGKINLWAYDNHHASAYGYYLEALMDFEKITNRDPRMFGRKEQGAVEIGLSPRQAVALQNIAYQQVHD